ncbi:hypothetical protein C8T65DRAFT_732311 [Cerioporus squamosus]|nr:hypothetical protein C8T65DRAFT_732311 [Cerioporus squamosus]
MTSRAIACQDILHEIFLHLRPPGWWVTGDYTVLMTRRRKLRSTLAACATVNRTLSDYALSCLWRVLDDVTPLLRILMDKDALMHTAGVIDEFAWGRLQRYARLVRELVHTGKVGHYTISRSIWTALAAKLDGEPLFPFLQRLQMGICRSNPSACLLVISPSIRVLQFDSSHLEGPVVDLANTLFASLASTTPFAGDIRGVLPKVTHHLQCMGRLAQLHELDLLPFAGTRIAMHYPAMQEFSSLENLRVLKVIVHFKDLDSQAPCRGGFIALECLHVEGSLSDVQESLRMVASPHLLRGFEASIDESARLQSFQEFFDILRRAAVSLSSLLLKMDPFTGLKTSSAPMSLVKFVEPILALRHMQDLECLYIPYLEPPSDCDIVAFAAAWPGLRALKIHYRTTETLADSKGISFSALLDLSQRCPALEHVALPQLDVLHLPDPDSIPRIEHSRVRHVYFDNDIRKANLSEAELMTLATLFDRLFPNLDVSHASDWPAFLCDRVRYHVFRTLNLMRTSRRSGG